MSVAGSSTSRPSQGSRTAVWLGLTIALLVGMTGSSFAQSGPRGSEPGSGSAPGGGGVRPGGHHRMIARQALEGPPTPAVLRDSIGLQEDQLRRYAPRYSGYMAETGPARDNLRTSLDSMRAAFQSGDRSAARGRRDAIERQSKELSKRDQEFEKVLKQDLSKDQQKRYDEWKRSREEAEADHRHHMRRPPGGNL